MAQHRNNLRQLGKAGPELPAIGFGLMGLAGPYGEIPAEADCFAILDRALELGMTFWDTAEYDHLRKLKPTSKLNTSVSTALMTSSSPNGSNVPVHDPRSFSRPNLVSRWSEVL